MLANATAIAASTVANFGSQGIGLCFWCGGLVLENLQQLPDHGADTTVTRISHPADGII